MRTNVALIRLAALLPLTVVECAPEASTPRANVEPIVAVAALPSTAAPVPAKPLPVVPATSLVHVQVLAFNDFHGNLDPPHGHDGTVLAPEGVRIAAGGAAYLTAHVERLRANNPNTVVVSAGDLTGASPLASNLFRDEPTILIMNRLGLDFEGVGNHDFDRGLTELMRLQHGGPRASTPGVVADAGDSTFPGARFQYLAANVLGPDGGTVFAPYAIKTFGSVKVAFLGMTLQGTGTVTTKEAVKGLTFENEAKTANQLLPELRAQGVATTVIMLHQGGFQNDGGTYDGCDGLKGEILPILGALDPAFRVVVTAHTHQAYNCDFGGRLVTSAASYGRLITVIDLAIDPRTNALVTATAHNTPVTRDLVPDALVTELVAAYETRAFPVTEKIVGYQRGSFTRDPRAAHSFSCETPLGDLIADSQLEATRRDGAVVALMNPGGIRTDLVAADDPKSTQPIHYSAAFEVEPFGNRLITVTLTGAQLAWLLERQFVPERPRVLAVSKGFTYRYTYDVGLRSVKVDHQSMRLDGQVIDPNRRYRVTVNAFLAGGGDGFTLLRDATDRVEGPLDVDALVDYLGRDSSRATPLAPARKLERISGNGCE